jgi:leucyl aminopeptidase
MIMEKFLIPEIQRVDNLGVDQSVVCLIDSDSIPEVLKLSEIEKEYAKKRLLEKDECIFINSYYKCTYIIRIKDGMSDFYRKEELRKTAYKVKNSIIGNAITDLVITGVDSFEGAIEAFAEGLILSLYSFDKYITGEKSKNSNRYPKRILLHGNIQDASFKWLITITQSSYLTRNLINEPVNYLNATTLANEIRQMGMDSGFNVEVLNKGMIEALKMGGLLAVNKGSIDPPVFCILEWKPENCLNDHPIVLVGKGVVYDTGGLNIKTGDFMNHMKADMAGAAVVAGVFYAMARSAIPLHLIGLVPATDNRPGENAYAQGDIISLYNGLSVEVVNTDAEGRLILADAISYASNYCPELIIDIATLTGSATMTFGNHAIAVMGNAEREYFKILELCGNEVFERIAELPFWEEYGNNLKSNVADLKNIGGKEAGTITAGKFLEKFTQYPFIHMDIAGTTMLKKDNFYRTKEGTGSGLRILASFLKKIAENRTLH